MPRQSSARPPKPLVIAHRGSHASLPENTPAAFRAALSLGADGIECDVQKAADGTFVVMHDPPAPAGDLPGQPPRLAEVLPQLREARLLDVELKVDTLEPADCPRILAEIAASKLDPDAILVTSFAPELLPAWKAWGMSTGLLAGEELARLGLRRTVVLVRRLAPRWLCIPVQVFERLGMVRAMLLLGLARLAGYRLAFWTVNTEAQLAAVRPLADVVITDEVELMLRLLGRSQ